MSARPFSATSMHCIAPALRQGYNRLQVSENGNHFTDYGLVIETFFAVIIREVWPLWGVEAGMTRVLLRTNGTSQRARAMVLAKCDFGGACTFALTGREGRLSCVAPKHAPGLARVSLLQNEQVCAPKAAGDGAVVHFEYRPGAFLLARGVAPLGGPLRGGTTIAVLVGAVSAVGDVGVRDARRASSQPVGWSAIIFCKFSGTDVVVASFDGGSHVRCVAPRVSLAGAVRVRVVLGDTSPGASAEFAYIAPMSVRSVEPAAGPLGGGTRVRVRGNGFAAASPAGCASSPAAAASRPTVTVRVGARVEQQAADLCAAFARRLAQQAAAFVVAALQRAGERHGESAWRARLRRWLKPRAVTQQRADGLGV